MNRELFPLMFEILRNRIEQHRNRNELYTDWNESVDHAIGQLRVEDSECAELLDEALKGGDMHSLERRTGIQRDEINRILERGRNHLHRIISTIQGLPLP
jgi:hypothetical protein